jgi:hypothetical protein
MKRPTRHRLRRLLRRFVLGSGPLKRGSDRAQMVARFALVLVVLGAIPTAVAVTTAATHRLEAAAAAQAATQQAVRAEVLGQVPGPGDAGSQVGDQVDVRATWRAPDGHPVEGTVPAPVGAVAGTAVTVTLDRQGRPTAAPAWAAIPTMAFGYGVVPLAGMPLVAGLLYMGLCAGLDRRRARQWSRGWDAVATQWRTMLQ